jgi:hypothetical protein
MPMLPTYRRHTIADGSLPVWMAALLAAECQVTGNGFARTVDWRCRSGRAMYTNLGAETEIVHPFGIPLRRGETVIISWLRGETAYTVQLEPDCLAA